MRRVPEIIGGQRKSHQHVGIGLDEVGPCKDGGRVGGEGSREGKTTEGRQETDLAQEDEKEVA